MELIKLTCQGDEKRTIISRPEEVEVEVLMVESKEWTCPQYLLNPLKEQTVTGKVMSFFIFSAGHPKTRTGPKTGTIY